MFNITNHQGNANQNHNEIFYIHENSYRKNKQRKTESNNHWHNLKKLKPLCIAGRNAKWYNHN